MGCNQSADANNKTWAHAAHNGKNGTTLHIGQAALERYLALEEEIAQAEKGSPAMRLQQKKSQLESLKTKIAKAEKKNGARGRSKEGSSSDAEPDSNVEDLEAAEAEPEAVGDTKALFLEQSEQSEMSRSQQDQLDAVNKLEISRKELTSMRDQETNLTNEIAELETETERLRLLYEEQDALLSEIFGGQYGSAEENRLESLLDQHEEMRERIAEANFKWRQAQLMVDYAHKQLEHACKRWIEVKEVDPSELEGRYTIASEARNNLVAASQNIQGAQRYLSNVKFPYCAPPEVETLNKATAYIFTDMQTPERHQHAYECYHVTTKRCAALLQWISLVVSQTITRDLDAINASVKDTARKLRTERVRLIKIKVKEVLGKDVDIKVGDVNTDLVVNLNHNDLAMTEGIDPSDIEHLSEEELAALHSGELAPILSRVEVFNAEYMEDVKRLDEKRAGEKAAVTTHLKDKLAARRQRRALKNIEKHEKSVL